MLVNDFLENSAAQRPDEVALVCEGRRLTYTQIEEQANKVANGLLEMGVQSGDRVAIWLPNSVETVVGLFGILKAGGTFVILNATTKFDKLAYVLNNCTAGGLFAPGRHGDLLPDLFEAVPSLRFAIQCGSGAVESDSRSSQIYSFDQVLESYPDARPSCSTIDIDLACLIYTSGSTGDPKGVMSTHRNVAFAASSIIEYLENVPEDIIINVLPLAFDYGLYQLLMAFKFGGALVLERSFTYPAAVLNRIAAENVTGLPGVPTVFAMLLQLDLNRFDLSSIRYLTNTAAALPVDHIRQLRDAFPWARLYSMYGLTESKRTLYLPPEELNRRPGSVGIPIPGTDAWVEGDDGEKLSPGEVGELVVRGSHVMQGYWRDPDETAKRFRPGRYPAERLLYTGDLFRMDEEGFFYFVSRKDDIIKSRGEKVAPKEVESVIYQLPEVVEAAVVGVPDDLLGQAVKAFVVCGDDHSLTERDVLRHCARHLEDFMVPKNVEFRDSLPKTSSGKIRVSSLRDEREG
jgi:amino acid adenylation domain-containing protein